MIDEKQPPEQDLNVNDFEIVTRHRDVDSPPDILLDLDVTHTETGMEWRTRCRLSRQQAEQFAVLLHHVFYRERLTWPGGTAG